MEKFLKKQREILAVLLYALLISGLCYMVIRPLLSKINSTMDRIQEEQIRQESSKKHLEELPKIKEEYQMIKDTDLKKYLLDRGNEVALIEKLEALAAGSGNKISIAVQDQEKNKAAATKTKKGVEQNITADLPSDNYLQLEIVLNGDFNSIGKFVKSLETFDYYSDIIGMEIKNLKETSKTSSTSPFSDAKPEENGNSITGVEASLNTVFYVR